MKIKLVGEAREFTTTKEDGAVVKLHLPLKETVQGVPMATKEAAAGLNLYLQARVAEELKFGQKLYVTVETQDPDAVPLVAEEPQSTVALRELSKLIDEILAQVSGMRIPDDGDRDALDALCTHASVLVRKELGL